LPNRIGNLTDQPPGGNGAGIIGERGTVPHAYRRGVLQAVSGDA